MEAALLADQGLQGNSMILDMPSGFGAFYDDFSPESLLAEYSDKPEFLLHYQDIALKRFPAHLGMHWAIDAALVARASINTKNTLSDIKSIVVRAPKYVVLVYQN